MSEKLCNVQQKNSELHVVTLGTGLSHSRNFDLSGYEGYQNFTAAKNIFVEITSYAASSRNGPATAIQINRVELASQTTSKTYDPSTGQLNVYCPYTYGEVVWTNGGRWNLPQQVMYYNVYLVY